MHHRLALAIAASTLLAACGQASRNSSDQTASASSRPRPSAPTRTATHAPPAGTKRFQSTRLGFYIDYPSAMASSPRFDSKYLANAAWKTYASPGSQGTDVLMLTLPDSNDVTAGELRIGVSDHKKEVRQCDQPSDAAVQSTQSTTDVNGTTFATWHARDAAMSHYLKVHSYRVVHDGDCFAIDLLVIGTNPKVYDPPRTPPFSQKAAFAQLQKALQGFHFMQ